MPLLKKCNQKYCYMCAQFAIIACTFFIIWVSGVQAVEWQPRAGYYPSVWVCRHFCGLCWWYCGGANCSEGFYDVAGVDSGSLCQEQSRCCSSSWFQREFLQWMTQSSDSDLQGELSAVWSICFWHILAWKVLSPTIITQCLLYPSMKLVSGNSRKMLDC